MVVLVVVVIVLVIDCGVCDGIDGDVSCGVNGCRQNLEA